MSAICRHYTSEPVFPRLRSLVWEETGCWRDIDLPAEECDQCTPALFTLLRLAPRVETLFVFSSIAQVYHARWLGDLKDLLSPAFRSLSLECLEGVGPGTRAGIRPFLAMPGLKELCLAYAHYDVLQINHEGVEVLMVLCDEEVISVRDFLPQLVAVAPKLQRLRLGIDSIVFATWTVDALEGLFQVKGLKELQLFTQEEGRAPPLTSSNVHTLAMHWRDLQVLNIYLIFGCPVSILETFSQALPQLQKLAIFFTEWHTVSRSTARLANLQVISFDVKHGPRDSHGIRSFAEYLASVLAPTTRFSKACVYVPSFQDFFSNLIEANDSWDSRFYRAFRIAVAAQGSTTTSQS